MRSHIEGIGYKKCYIDILLQSEIYGFSEISRLYLLFIVRIVEKDSIALPTSRYNELVSEYKFECVKMGCKYILLSNTYNSVAFTKEDEGGAGGYLCWGIGRREEKIGGEHGGCKRGEAKGGKKEKENEEYLPF